MHTDRLSFVSIHRSSARCGSTIQHALLEFETNACNARTAVDGRSSERYWKSMLGLSGNESFEFSLQLT